MMVTDAELDDIERGARANVSLLVPPHLIARAEATVRLVAEVRGLRRLCCEAGAALDAQRMHEETCRRCVCRVERDVADSLLARLRTAGGDP